jgi:enoyl-CoA hydratase/carnithine racemase
MSYKDFAIEQKGRVVCVTLNRPERMNALGSESSREFLEILTDYRDDPQKWVMIITATGKGFCTGMYVDEGADKTQAKGKADGYDVYRPWTDMMQSIHKPFICAVNGFCVGGGWHLVADSDIVIASDKAQFLDTHVHLGLINGVESAGLMRKMPYGIVMRMVMEGRHFRVNAQQALQWGLVSEVVPPDQLQAKAWEIATHIAEDAAPLAVWGSKKAMLGALDRGATEGIAFAWETLSDIANSSDTVEGFRAFAEKRKPNFTGT